MVKIITDSTCDIEAAEAAKLGIETIPLRVLFGEQSFEDGVDLSKAEFYQKLTHAKALPTTSQVNPDAFAKAFETHIQAKDTVVCICISEKLSGTYQSAMIAKGMVEGEIYVVDSNTATIGASILIRQAVKLRDAGKSAADIHAALCAMTQKVKLVAVVNTLKYLKMGGRISSTTAVVGGILGISPIVAVENGAVTSIGKVRGQKAAIAFIEQYMKDHGIDTNYPVGFAYAGDNLADMQQVMHHFNFADCFYDQLGTVIGTHAGPGAIAIAFISNK